MHDQTQYLKTPNRKSPSPRQTSGKQLTPLQIALGQGQADTTTESAKD